ncbi:hypothetical protein GGGNBK_18110 [Sporosarcina sp. ANT_H38]
MSKKIVVKHWNKDHYDNYFQYQYFVHSDDEVRKLSL